MLLMRWCCWCTDATDQIDAAVVDKMQIYVWAHLKGKALSSEFCTVVQCLVSKEFHFLVEYFRSHIPFQELTPTQVSTLKDVWNRTEEKKRNPSGGSVLFFSSQYCNCQIFCTDTFSNIYKFTQGKRDNSAFLILKFNFLLIVIY